MNNKSSSKARMKRTPVSGNAGCALAVWLLYSSAAVASAPDWLRAAAQTQMSEPVGDADAAVLFDEHITTVTDSGEIKTLYRRAYKILRPNIRNRGAVVVFFDNETRLTYLKGWSILPSGKDYEVKEKDAVETSVFSGALYQDTRYKVLQIPAAEPGNVIGYEYEQKRRPAILQDIWDFQQDVPVRMARFELRLPAGWEYKASWLNHAAVEPRSPASNRWFWELADLPAVEREPRMPHWQGVAGWLGVTYYGRDTISGQQNLSSWRDIGLWYGKLAADRCKPSAAIRQKVIELTASVSKPLDRIRVLAAFVQKEIRYVAIEVGIGGYQPHSAEDVYTNRYGDCKDKATLLRTMLAEIGVDSYYVLINSHRGIVSPNFSSALGFNHVILAIRLPEETGTGGLFSIQRDAQRGTLLYFDPTDTLVALGTLPESLQMSFGLLISEAGGELEQLPLAAPALNKLMRSAKLVLSPSGAIQGAVTEMCSGAPANELRAQLLRASASERYKLLETFLGRFVGSSVMTGSHVENLEDPSSTLVIHYSFEATGYAKSAGDLMLIRPRILGQKGDDVFEFKPGVQRKYPVEFPYTSLQSDLVEISIPAGYAVDELPAATDISMPFGEYHSRCEVTGNSLRYARRYQINALRVPVEQWQALQSFHSRIAMDERMNAVLKQVK